MHTLSDNQVREAIKALNEELHNATTSSNSLEIELAAASKHVPAYVKVVKGHIDQLRQVLQLENHNNRALENINLAKPVEQLIEIFQILEEEDVQLLEELAYAARNWQTEPAEQAVTEATESTTATTL